MNMGMNCQDWLSRLETGGPIVRLLARRHVRGCAKCAAVYRRWNDVKAELSHAEPLSPELRNLWIEARHAPAGAEHEPSLPRRRVSKLAWIAAAACLAGLLSWGLWSTSHRERDPRPASQQPTEAAIATGDPAAQLPALSDGQELHGEPAAVDELAQLEGKIDQLDAELANLTQQAERLDARRTADEMIDRYSQWHF